METVRNARKEIVGVVASAKMDKTIVVAVVRNVKHPKYGKYFKRPRSIRLMTRPTLVVRTM